MGLLTFIDCNDMRTRVFYVAAIAALLFSSCKKEADVNVIPESDSADFSITATTADTKTANDGMATEWSASDRIALFHAPAGSSDYIFENPFEITAENLALNKFTGTLKSQLDPAISYNWFSVYPYNENATDPTCVPVTIGSPNGVQEQVGGNGSMSKVCGVNVPLWAKATAGGDTKDLSLAMNNMASVLKLKVLNTYFNQDFKLTKIWVKIGEETLNGTYTVDLTSSDSPVFTAVEGKNAIEVHINENDIVLGNLKNNGLQYAEVYAVIKPFTAPAGTRIRITVTGEVNGEEKAYENSMNLSSAVSFNAGKIREINVKTSADPVYVCEPNVVEMPAGLDGKVSGASFIDANRLAFSTVGGANNDQIWVYNFTTKSSEKLMDLGNHYPYKLTYNATDNKIYFISKPNGYVRWVNPDNKSNDYAVKNEQGGASYFGAGRGFMDIEFDSNNNMYVLERDNFTIALFSRSSNYLFESRNEGYFYFGNPKKPRSMCTDGKKLYAVTCSDDSSDNRMWSKDLTSGSVATVSWSPGNVVCMMVDAKGNILWSKAANKIYKSVLGSDGTQSSISGIEAANVVGWPDGGMNPVELVPSPDGKNAFYILDNAHNQVHKITVY